eukprot:3408474-Amphidinium_carterae.1
MPTRRPRLAYPLGGCVSTVNVLADSPKPCHARHTQPISSCMPGIHSLRSSSALAASFNI